MFSLESRIGRGRTVETFSAKLEVGGEAMAVVVKKPRPELVADASFTAALIAWGAREKELEHEGLVAVLEAGKTADGAYVIEEKVNGPALADLLAALAKQKRTLTLPLALAVIERVLSALAYLHAKGGAHGGIDPGEVLVSYEGEVKLGDQRLHTLDPPGGELGEHEWYRAPELAQRPGTLSPAGDVYAAALLLLEMLLGRRVWTSPNMSVEASIKAIKDFSPAGQAHAALAEELADILRSSTLKDPLDRVPDAKQLHAGIARVIGKYGAAVDRAALGAFVSAALPPRSEEAPTMVGPAGAPEPRAPSVRPQPAQLAPGPAASVAVPVSVPAERKPSAQWPKPPPVKKRPDWQLAAGAAVIALIVIMMIVHMATRTGANVNLVQVSATSDPPGAALYLDGEPAGTTPVNTTFPVHHGHVRMKFVLEGYETYEVNIETREDELRYEARMRKIVRSRTP